MKRCFKCSVIKPLDQFYAHKMMADGHLNKCKDCTKRDVRMYRVENPLTLQSYERERSRKPERRAAQVATGRGQKLRVPEKYAARLAVSNAIRDGRLTRKPCEVCGTTERVEAHHDDYSKPLEVRWLCFFHHRTIAHGQVVVSA